MNEEKPLKCPKCGEPLNSIRLEGSAYQEYDFKDGKYCSGEKDEDLSNYVCGKCLADLPKDIVKWIDEHIREKP